MSCLTCNKALTPAYMPCSQCKRRAGYLLIDEPLERDAYWKLAASLMNSDFRLDSLHAEPNLSAVLERKRWMTADQGSMGWHDAQRIAKVCADYRISNLVGVFIERIYEHLEGHEELSLEEQIKISKEIPYVAKIGTSADELRNYFLDFPLSLVLFPNNLEFLIYQHTIEAVLIAGSKVVVEGFVGKSIEDSIPEFIHFMDNAGQNLLANHFLDDFIYPANAAAQENE